MKHQHHSIYPLFRKEVFDHFALMQYGKALNQIGISRYLMLIAIVIFFAVVFMGDQLLALF